VYDATVTVMTRQLSPAKIDAALAVQETGAFRQR
jgi:hypothetical protein